MTPFGVMANGRRKTLFVFNGESNSGGFALNSQATVEELSPRSSVNILDNTGLASFLPLDVGTNNLVGHTGISPSPTHGFEIELANRADTIAFYRKPCYLVKTGQGGSTAAQWQIGNGSGYYTAILNRINAAKSLLAGVNYRKIILLSLGINDAIAGTNLTTWKALMTTHFANLRAQLGGSTPIIMTQFQGMGASPSAYDALNTAIQELCDTLPHTYCVSAAGAGLQDTNHWSYVGMKVVAGRMLDIAETL